MQPKNTLVTEWEIRAAGRHNRVYMVDNIRDLMKHYQLTAAQVNYLAKGAGGYPHADMRIEKNLIKRGISEMADEGYFVRTPLGNRICAELFVVIDLNTAIEVENWPTHSEASLS